MGQVRCDYCGWSENPDGAKTCQKCNQELVYSAPAPATAHVVAERVKSTAQEKCTKCGYPLVSDAVSCPNCGTQVGSPQPVAADPRMKQTIRDVSVVPTVPVMKQTVRDVSALEDDTLKQTVPEILDVVPGKTCFRLKPMDVDTQEVFAFGAGGNAAFEYENGKWYIRDNGDANSTYVCAARSIELQSGDVVLIGGRKYLFE